MNSLNNVYVEVLDVWLILMQKWTMSHSICNPRMLVRSRIIVILVNEVPVICHCMMDYHKVPQLIKEHLLKVLTP